jgi:hypothetical protein
MNLRPNVSPAVPVPAARFSAVKPRPKPKPRATACPRCWECLVSWHFYESEHRRNLGGCAAGNVSPIFIFEDFLGGPSLD